MERSQGVICKIILFFDEYKNCKEYAKHIFVARSDNKKDFLLSSLARK